MLLQYIAKNFGSLVGKGIQWQVILEFFLLAIPFIALWAGIPMWLVLRRPEAKPTIAAAPAVRTLPVLRYDDEHASYRRVA